MKLLSKIGTVVKMLNTNETNNNGKGIDVLTITQKIDASSVTQGALAGGASGGLKECASCGKRITERFLLKALDLFWHEDCLKCGCCDCRLGEVGSTLYQKANLILCKRDYLR
ncbi:hypothetical protein M8J75_011707 [Diaphorina citri]|nr:hypothetical protein M8J75_011707 [Diaphorina citri]